MINQDIKKYWLGLFVTVALQERRKIGNANTGSL